MRPPYDLAEWEFNFSRFKNIEILFFYVKDFNLRIENLQGETSK